MTTPLSASGETLQVWTLVVAVVAVSFSVFQHFRQRRRRRIGYHVRTTGLLSVNQQVREHIKVLYRDVAVSELRLVELSFEHLGNETIKAADFEVPIRIGFGASARILTSEVAEVEPKNLDLHVTVNTIAGAEPNPGEPHHAVQIAPLLLNAGDRFALRFLVAEAETPTINARIAGVKELELRAETQEPRWRAAGAFIATLLAVVAGVCSVLWLIGELTTKPPRFALSFAADPLAVIVTALVLLAVTVKLITTKQEPAATRRANRARR